MQRVMHRLFAEAVAGDSQLAFRLVVDREREHAAQFLHALGAHVFVKMKDAFGIGFRREAMAAAFEVGTKLGKIVDFAVEDDPGAAVFVKDGLVAGGEIDDGKPAHAEARAIGYVDAFIVRAAMPDCVAHVAHESFGNVALARCADDSGNSAHDPSILSRLTLALTLPSHTDFRL